MTFTDLEKSIITLLYCAQKPLTTFSIAGNVDVSWINAKKHLLHLRTEGIVAADKFGKSVYWWLVTEDGEAIT